MHGWRRVVPLLFLLLVTKGSALAAPLDRDESPRQSSSATGDRLANDEYGYILSMSEAEMIGEDASRSAWQHRISSENSATDIASDGKIESDWRYRWESFWNEDVIDGNRGRLLIDVVDKNKEWYSYGFYDWLFSRSGNPDSGQTRRWHFKTAAEYGYFEEQLYARLASTERFKGLTLSIQWDNKSIAWLNTWEVGARWQRVERRDEITLPLRTVDLSNEKDLVLPFIHTRYLYTGESVDTQIDLRYEKNIGDDEQTGIEIFLEGGERELNFQRIEAQLFQHWWMQQYYLDESLLQGFFSYELSAFDGFGEALVSDGQWPVGGKYSVRGYDDDVSSADSGELLRVEIGYYYFHSALKKFRAFAFFDTARYQIEASEFVTDSQFVTDAQTLVLRSTGLGIELSLPSGLAAEVTWGRVLKSVTDIAQQGDHRFHITLSWTF